VERLTTLDGDSLSEYENIVKRIVIPAKDIMYLSSLKMIESTGGNVFASASSSTIKIQPKIELFSKDIGDLLPTDTQISGILTPPNTQFVNTNSETGVEVYFNLKCTVLNRLTSSVKFQVAKYDGATTTLIGNEVTVGNSETKSFTLTGTSSLNTNNHRIFIVCQDVPFNGTYDFAISFEDGSEITYRKLETLDDSQSQVSLIHELLSRTCEIISGLTVKSNWYGRDDSDVNPLISGVGGGALKAITSGRLLRDRRGVDGVKQSVQTSFRDLFESLTAIDNIGWSFEYDDDGVIECVRIEQFNYFYQNTNILTINNPSEYRRTLDPSRIYSRLKIGYQKFADTGDINTIDTFHTQRDYSSQLKSVDNELVRISKFVACPYAIEFTRRKIFEMQTKDWKYDDDLFVFELARNTGVYSVKVGATGLGAFTTIISPLSYANIALSPARNAMNHLGIMFISNSTLTDLLLTSIKGNTGAICAREGTGEYLHLDPADGMSIAENATLSRVEPIYTPEVIECEYPISQADWDMLNADRYGLITVNSVPCWLSEASRSPLTGITKFKLIPKNV
jgi:hypothetical protein